MSRPREYDGHRVTCAVRLPDDLHARLRDAAREREVSMNRLIERAVSEYLDRLVPISTLLRPTEEDA